MGRFLTKLLLFCIVIIILSYGVDYLIQEGIKTSSYREISKWNEVIEGGIDAEILIVGSSRALVHFDPRIIEEKTGMTCYNLGLEGSKYEAQTKVLELYLEKNIKPKILIWSLDFGSFEEVEGIYRYEQFIPFWSEPKVKEILSLNKGMGLGYLNLPIIRFFNNSAIKYRGLLSWLSVKFHQPILEKGYRVSDKAWDGNLDGLIDKSSGELAIEFQEDQFVDFKNVTKMLVKQNVQVQWVITPYYKTALEAISNRKENIDLLKNESSKIGVNFHDYSYYEVSISRDNFYNGSHLNQKGVGLFSDILELCGNFKLETINDL